MNDGIVTSVDWEAIGFGVICGLLAGQLFTRWAIWGYIKAKRPDAVAHRTGIFIDGQMYYLVSGPEYLRLLTEEKRQDKKEASQS